MTIFCKRHTRPVAFRTQQLFIGAFYDSLADFVDATFQIARPGSAQAAVSVFTRRDAEDAFEVSDKVTLVSATYSPNDLFDAEKCCGEKSCGLLQAH